MKRFHADVPCLFLLFSVTRDIIDRRLQPDAEPKSDMMVWSSTFFSSLPLPLWHTNVL